MAQSQSSAFDVREYVASLLRGSPAAAVDAAAAISAGTCARCALRFAGLSLEALYALSDADETDAALRDALAAAPQPLPRPSCSACAGLLAGRATVRLQAAQMQAFSAADKGAACSLGVSYGGAALRQMQPARASGDWLGDATAAVAAAGYDLRGGVTMELSVAPSLVEADERAFARAVDAAAVAHAAAGTRGGAARRLAWPLKDVLHSLAALALARLRTPVNAGGCVVLRVGAFEAAADAAAATVSPAAAVAPPAAGAPPPRWDEVLLVPSAAAAWPPETLHAAAVAVGAGDVDGVAIDLSTPTAGTARGGSGAAADSQFTAEKHAHVRAALDALAISGSAGGAAASTTEPLRVGAGSLTLRLFFDAPPAAAEVVGARGGGDGGAQQRRGRKRPALAASSAVAAPPPAAAAAPTATPIPAPPADECPAALPLVGGGAAGGAAAASVGVASVAATDPLPTRSGDDAANASEALGAAATRDLPLPPTSGPSAPLPLCSVDMTLTRSPLYLRARYNKFARGLSQSPWFVEGQRIGSFESSVEELIAVPALEYIARITAPEPSLSSLDGSRIAVAAPPISAAAVSTSATATAIAVAVAVSTSAATPAGRCARIPPVVISPPLLLGSRREDGAGAWPWRRNGAVLVTPPATSAGGFKFHSAGREDVDVRMLGPGRPCVVELLDCRSLLLPARALAELAAAVNSGPGAGKVALRAVAPATREEFVALQSGAEAKRKRYTALCWAAVPHTAEALRSRLAGVRDLKVAQLTPMRVLHRRSLLTRTKTIHALDVEELPPAVSDGGHVFLLHVVASAGTYIKEFVHSDRGRTRPNVGELLGCRVDILTLDVTGLMEGGAGDDDSDDE